MESGIDFCMKCGKVTHTDNMEYINGRFFCHACCSKMVWAQVLKERAEGDKDGLDG